MFITVVRESGVEQKTYDLSKEPGPGYNRSKIIESYGFWAYSKNVAAKLMKKCLN